MGCHFLLQGIFPTQGLNLGLQHCRQILCCMSHLKFHTNTKSGLQYSTALKVKVASNSLDYTVCGILQARILEWVAFPFCRASSQPRDQTQVFAFQVDSLPAEPQGKPEKNGVGSLSLHQGIFLTQESNQGLLHCRWILYQLSHKGSLFYCTTTRISIILIICLKRPAQCSFYCSHTASGLEILGLLTTRSVSCY